MILFYVCFACMRMYNYVNVYYACRGQHWVLDALETELGMDISHHMGSGNQTNQGPLDKQKILLTTEQSLHSTSLKQTTKETNNQTNLLWIQTHLAILF